MRAAVAPLLLGLGLIACRAVPPAAKPPRTVVVIGGESFRLEVARDAATRWQGLSDRSAIASDGGMVFVYPDDRPRAMVMRRCHVPIDVVILAADGTIVYAHEMPVEPPGTAEEDLPQWGSPTPARYVIELAGGTVARLGVRVGQRVRLPSDLAGAP